MEGQIRPTLMQATEVIEEELLENDYKGGWESSSIWDIQNRVWTEMRELEGALTDYHRDPSDANRARVRHEAADVQGMVMMVADLAGCYPHGARVNGRDTEGLSPVETLVNAGWDRQEAEDDIAEDQAE